ncbi:hypothetical protein [Tersicoccus phoenicis]|uniref:hypothetical protein n=1 Tax=Tersicoccus phoenicis TaxID=554083 RepID=UPI0011804CBF|nr:hypothetical protein [Tersicoccus phoenicis]
MDRASVRFGDLRVTDATRIDVNCELRGGPQDGSYPLWFEFSQPIGLTQDSIAIALSTLCGRAFERIELDLSPSDETARAIEKFTLAEVKTSGRRAMQSSKRKGILLSFSGGFDSLAAYSLMPRDTRLVSMDFGGRFGREREFFQHFDTLTVSTNLLETPLKNNSWSFMGCGAILAAAHSRAKYHTFGSILEASPDNLRQTPAAAANKTFPPFHMAGLTNAPYVAGLTEVGTLIVLAHYHPDLIAPSLRSLASPGEEKLYRKKVLARVVSARFGWDITTPDVTKPSTPHFSFGQNFALDFLSIYVARHGGPDLADELVSGIPDHILASSSRLHLTFYERADTTLYLNFPADLAAGLARNLASAGVRPYTELDWVEFQQVRSLLAPYHPVVVT